MFSRAAPALPHILFPAHRRLLQLSLHFLFLSFPPRPGESGPRGKPQLECFLHCSGVTPAPTRPEQVPLPGQEGTEGLKDARCQRQPFSVPFSTSVPVENPAASLIIGREDFQRLTEASRVLSKEEREAKLVALRAEKEAVLVGISHLAGRAAGGEGCTQPEPLRDHRPHPCATRMLAHGGGAAQLQTSALPDPPSPGGAA